VELQLGVPTLTASKFTTTVAVKTPVGDLIAKERSFTVSSTVVRQKVMTLTEYLSRSTSPRLPMLSFGASFVVVLTRTEMLESYTPTNAATRGY